MIDELKDMFAEVIAAGGTDKVLELPANHPVFVQTEAADATPAAEETVKQEPKAKKTARPKKKKTSDE
mgnify:FL=1